jgi:hypothetical protein
MLRYNYNEPSHQHYKKIDLNAEICLDYKPNILSVQILSMVKNRSEKNMFKKGSYFVTDLLNCLYKKMKVYTLWHNVSAYFYQNIFAWKTKMQV